MLPFSHDEVVHGKGLDARPDAGRPLAAVCQPATAVRLQWTHPGKKLLFMGGEFAQWNEWNCDSESAMGPVAVGVAPGHAEDGRRSEQLSTAANRRSTRSTSSHTGFEWIDCHNHNDSVLVYLRRANQIPHDFVLVACNFTPVVRKNYRLGVPEGGLVRGNLQYRLQVLRRQQRRQLPGPPGRGKRKPRATLLSADDFAAAGGCRL